MPLTTRGIKGSQRTGELLAQLIASSATLQQEFGAGSQQEAMDRCFVNEVITKYPNHRPPYALVIEGNRSYSRRGTTIYAQAGTLEVEINLVYDPPDDESDDQAWKNLQADVSNTFGQITDEILENSHSYTTENPMSPGKTYVSLSEWVVQSSPVWMSLAEYGEVDDPDENNLQKMLVWQQITAALNG